MAEHAVVTHVPGSHARHTAGHAYEDLLEGVESTAHANDEAKPCLQDPSLSCIAEGQQGDSSEQQHKKHACRHGLSRSLQDQVK